MVLETHVHLQKSYIFIKFIKKFIFVDVYRFAEHVENCPGIFFDNHCGVLDENNPKICNKNMLYVKI